MPPTVVVLAPSPLLTVTIEELAAEADIHVHAGGQGIWQARMISSLGVEVVVCAGLGGEIGQVLEHLIPGEGLTLRSLAVQARNGGYVHDRRDGERRSIAEAPAGAFDRHEQDALYELALREGLVAGFALLSGPHDLRVLPDAMYTRLATDLAANGCTVAVDLSGSRLTAVLAGAPALVKVSHEELIEDDRADGEDAPALVRAMRDLREEGAGTVVVSRAADPALALVEDEVIEIHVPPLEAAEPKGAGDSMTAGMVAALVRGLPTRDALRLGAACGALNVVRHGLGTGGRDTVETLAERVELAAWAEGS